ncbi:MAG: hypothetical protein U0531_07735 [Dehalococcoidia bacterium]
MQGRADVFTTKSATERKQVLAEILDLGRSDEYEARAKDRRNERGREADLLDRRIADDQRRLDRLPSARAERVEQAGELTAVQTDRDTAVQLRDRLRADAAQAQRLRDEIGEAATARDEAVRALALAQEQMERRRAAIDRYASVAARADATRDGYAALLTARNEARDLSAAVASLTQTLAEATRVVTDLEGDVQRTEGRVAGRQREIAGAGAVLADAGAIRNGYAALVDARAAEREQGRRRLLARAIDERMAPLQQAVNAAESALRAELHAEEREEQRLAALATRRDALRAEKAGVDRMQVEIDALEKRRETARAEESENRATAQALHTDIDRLKTQVGEVRRRRDELKLAAAAGAADCPLCGSNLGADTLRTVMEDYQRQNREIEAQYKVNRERANAAEGAAEAAARTARDLDAEVSRRRGEWQRTAGRIERDLAECETAARTLVEAQAIIATTRRTLAEGGAAPAEREGLAALSADLAAIGYDRAAEAEAHARTTELAPFEERHTRRRGRTRPGSRPNRAGRGGGRRRPRPRPPQRGGASGDGADRAGRRSTVGPHRRATAHPRPGPLRAGASGTAGRRARVGDRAGAAGERHHAGGAAQARPGRHHPSPGGP